MPPPSGAFEDDAQISFAELVAGLDHEDWDDGAYALDPGVFDIVRDGGGDGGRGAARDEKGRHDVQGWIAERGERDDVQGWIAERDERDDVQGWIAERGVGGGRDGRERGADDVRGRRLRRTEERAPGGGFV
jgi:hypothetical protein